MRVQVDLRIYQRSRELLKAVRRAALGQLMGEIFSVVICQVHHCFTTPHVCDVDVSSGRERVQLHRRPYLPSAHNSIAAASRANGCACSLDLLNIV